MKVTRRDVLTAAGGGVVGIMLTPAPWKLVDDLAIWTQNWKWIPRPPRGPQTVKATACSLCPRGCAADARCIGGLPVAMRAAAGGTLCALGLTAHHLPYHPARLTESVRVSRDGARPAAAPVPLDVILAEATRARHRGRVAVLDTRPGRSVSWAWAALLGGLPQATIIPAPGRDGASFDALAYLAGADGAVGADFARAKSILSFGAPLAEGAVPRATLERILAHDLRLVQVEPVRSQTAAFADRWIPCHPGREAALAVAIAKALAGETLPASVEAETGVPAATVGEVARVLAANRPAIVLAGDYPGGGRHGAATEAAALALNARLGAFDGGVLVRRAVLPAPVDGAPLAPAGEIQDVADGSISLMIVDASAGDAVFPWGLVERKLAKGAVVIALSPFFAGTAAHADFIVPTAPLLEASFEVPAPSDAPAATLSVGAAVLPARESSIDPAWFIRSLAERAGIAMAGAWTTSEELAKLRVARIHAAARGSLVDRSDTVTPVASFGSADEIWSALMEGARWIDEPGQPVSGLRSPLSAPSPEPVPEPGDSGHLVLLPIAARDVAQSAAVSPVLTKLYSESALRASARTAILNPTTASRLALRDGARATIETDEGVMAVAIATDEAVMPGTCALVVGPERNALGEAGMDEPGNGARRAPLRAIDLCSADSAGTWRASAARVVEG